MVIRPDGSGGHLDPLEIAEHAEGLLETERAATVEAHLASCGQCRDVAASVAGVTTTLAAQPREVPIPDGVAARIDAALADEAASRTAPAAQGSGAEGFWARLRGRMPAIAAGAASVAVLGLIGYAISETGGGDDTATDAGAGVAESDDSGDAAEAPMDAPNEATEEEGSADEGAGADAEDESAITQDEPGAAGDESRAESGDGEQAEAETFGSDLPARELDALIAEMQDLLAARGAEAEPGADGAPCGTVLSEELGGELLGSAETDTVEPGSYLVAIDLDDPDTVTGWVVPECTAGPADALANIEVPRPAE